MVPLYPHPKQLSMEFLPMLIPERKTITLKTCILRPFKFRKFLTITKDNRITSQISLYPKKPSSRVYGPANDVDLALAPILLSCGFSNLNALP